MLTMILGILKVIGILILVVLAILLLILLLLLFCPVRYSGSADREEAGGVKARADVTWLLHLLHLTVAVEGTEPVFSVRILGIAPEKFGRLKSIFRHKKAVSGKKTESKLPEPQEEAGKKVSVQPSACADKKTEHKPDAESASEEKKQTTEKTAFVSSLAGRLVFFLKKALHLPGRLADALKHGKDKLRRDVRNARRAAKKASEWKAFVSRQECRDALTLIWKKFSRLIRHILPGKLSGQVNFGFSDPADTGMLLAVFAPFYPLYGEYVQIVPDFQEKRFSFSLDFKGRIYGFMVLYVALGLFLDKNVQMIIRKIRKKEV